MTASPKPKPSPGLFMRVLRFLLFAVVALGTLVVLAYTTINLWGRLEWNKTKNELLAMGEPLSFSELLPPEIPDEENFFATESWKKLVENEVATRAGQTNKPNPFQALMVRQADGKNRSLGTMGKRGGNLYGRDRLTDFEGFEAAFLANNIVSEAQETPATTVLAGFAQANALMADIEEGALRPSSRSPFKVDPKNLIDVPLFLPHLHSSLALGQALSLRSVARMASGDPHGAAKDILLILRLAEALQSDPFLISKLVQRSCLSMAIPAFWEGTAIGTWGGKDLAKIQEAFLRCRPADDLAMGYRFDRGLFNEWFSQLSSREEFIRVFRLMEGKGASDLFLKLFPSGFLLSDQASLNRSVQEEIEALKSGSADQAEKLEKRQQSRKSSWRTLIADTAFPGVRGEVVKTLNFQSQLNLAIVACALERYRLNHGMFPPTLETLMPDFLEVVPTDPVTGQPITYSLVSPDNYSLVCLAVKSRQTDRQLPDGRWTWNRLPATIP